MSAPFTIPDRWRLTPLQERYVRAVAEAGGRIKRADLYAKLYPAGQVDSKILEVVGVAIRKKIGPDARVGGVGAGFIAFNDHALAALGLARAEGPAL